MNKKILIVTLHYLNGAGGGVFASRAYINAIAEVFKVGEVTLLYPAGEGHPIEGIDPRVKAIPVYNNKPRFEKGLDLLVGNVHRNFKVLPELLKKEKFDIIVFDNSKVSFRMIDLAHRNGAKVITIHHNCELEYVRDNSSSLLKNLNLYWTRKYEGEALRKSDINLVLTPEDRELLINHYAKGTSPKVEVIGTFESKPEDDSEYESSEVYSENRERFVITGNLSAQQTEKSLLPWLDTYYPILKDEIPDAQLVIAGKNPYESITKKCRALGIVLIPSPKEMAPILLDADCYICPTALGGGLKLRIMDGLKQGLPVITHEVSARGYHDFANAGVLFSYHDADTFRAAIRQVKDLPINANAVRSLYRSVFSFPAGVRRLSNILNNI